MQRVGGNMQLFFGNFNCYKSCQVVKGIRLCCIYSWEIQRRGVGYQLKFGTYKVICFFWEDIDGFKGFIQRNVVGFMVTVVFFFFLFVMIFFFVLRRKIYVIVIVIGKNLFVQSWFLYINMDVLLDVVGVLFVFFQYLFCSVSV